MAGDRRAGRGLILDGAMISWASKRQPVAGIGVRTLFSVAVCCVWSACISSWNLPGPSRRGNAHRSGQVCLDAVVLAQGARMYRMAKHIDARIYRDMPSAGALLGS
jgi:hypothetical protein